MPLLQRLRADGYRLTGPSLHNLDYCDGEVKLLNPFAVTKISEDK
jgi:hypothetical protein